MLIRTSWMRHLMQMSAAGFLFLCVTVMPGCPAKSDGKCAADADCASDATKKVCDKNGEKCVQCLESKHCATGEVCDTAAFTCRKGCNNAEDCKALPEFKDRKKVDCRASACVASCDSNEDCKADEKCADSKCIVGQRENLPGKYEGCPAGKCQFGLECLTYKGGTTNYCWKPCGKGCDADEICVKAAEFADGYDVCMKAIQEESGGFNYDQGTSCGEGLIKLTSGANNFGTCWKNCTDKCLGGRVCANHPGIQDKTVKLCFKPCQADTECPKGTRCRENTALQDKPFHCY